MAESETILRVKDLCKDFKIRSSRLGEKPKILHALHNVSMDIRAGETLGIIGESGCGKSTFGRCVAQLTPVTSGEIWYGGRDICKEGKKRKKQLHRDIQIIFQDPYSSLDPRMTAGRAIEEPMIIHGIEKSSARRREIVWELMQQVGLNVQHYSRYPHEFSGGQRQRINIARTLVLHPKVIVCDEPVSALDVSVQAQVLNLFRSLQAKYGFTYIFISHDLSVIKHISDRVAILYLGRVVETCPASEIYAKPLHPYTRALLSAIPPDSPFENSSELELQGDIPSPIGRMQGCPLASRCPNRMPECSEKSPRLVPVGPAHSVACFLYHHQVEE